MRAGSPRHSAQALVELALILPILMLVGLASVDFGRAYFAGVSYMQAAREGARYAATSTGSNTPTEAQAEQRVIDAIGGTAPAESGTTAGAAISTADVSIEVRDDEGDLVSYTQRASGYSVRVTVSGFVPFYTGFVVNGADTLAPGLNLCTGVGPNRRCGIGITGEAYMVVI